MLLSSFPPIIGADPRLLLLGSMPGEESLRQSCYYAHPANQFWAIMGKLVGAGPELPYTERVERLAHAGIALWDTLKHCERRGSLDSSIRPQTEVPNAIGELLERQPTIRLVAFNGKKSASSFERHVLPRLPAEVSERLSFVTLPSTSPANATLTRLEKLVIWQAALEPHLKPEAI